MSESEEKSLGLKGMLRMWASKAKENTIGTGMQAVVYPFGKLRASLYVGAKQGRFEFTSVPSNCIPYVVVRSAKPSASYVEKRVRLVLGTVAGVFCFNLADAQRQMTLQAENRGFASLLKPSELKKRTRGYAAGLTRTIMYNAMLTGNYSHLSYPQLLLALAKMTFFTGPLDYAAALKREFHNESYLEIMVTKMRVAPGPLARRYGVQPEMMQGLKILGLMSTIRMMTLTFEIFAFKVAIREFTKWRNKRKAEHL